MGNIFKSYSFNNEEYFDTIEDAAHQIDINIGDTRTAFEGESHLINVVPDLICVGDVIETIQERAYDQHGEVAEDYLNDISLDAKKDLHALLVSWVEKHNLQPTFCGIKNIKTIQVKLLDDETFEMMDTADAQ